MAGNTTPPIENGKLHCYLCPRHCRIGEGQNGFCYIRKNIGGKLYNLGYAQPAVVDAAVESGCPSIAFTYNEPTIWGEYVVDTSKLAHRQGLQTVMVTNGYITPEALRDVYRHIDAANVDLKFFTETFYFKSHSVIWNLFSKP